RVWEHVEDVGLRPPGVALGAKRLSLLPALLPLRLDLRGVVTGLVGHGSLRIYHEPGSTCCRGKRRGVAREACKRGPTVKRRSSREVARPHLNSRVPWSGEANAAPATLIEAQKPVQAVGNRWMRSTVESPEGDSGVDRCLQTGWRRSNLSLLGIQS